MTNVKAIKVKEFADPHSCILFLTKHEGDYPLIVSTHGGSTALNKEQLIELRDWLNKEFPDE